MRQTLPSGKKGNVKEGNDTNKDPHFLHACCLCLTCLVTRLDVEAGGANKNQMKGCLVVGFFSKRLEDVERDVEKRTVPEKTESVNDTKKGIREKVHTESLERGEISSGRKGSRFTGSSVLMQKACDHPSLGICELKMHSDIQPPQKTI